jgi:hypothetical protein
MDREQQLAEELRLLRSLCDERMPREQRWEMMRSLGANSFAEPEHQVVLEAIRALLPLGPLSEERLSIYLTKHGFPDTDVSRYFRTAT